MISKIKPVFGTRSWFAAAALGAALFVGTSGMAYAEQGHGGGGGYRGGGGGYHGGGGGGYHGGGWGHGGGYGGWGHGGGYGGWGHGGYGWGGRGWYGGGWGWGGWYGPAVTVGPAYYCSPYYTYYWGPGYCSAW